MDSSDDSFDERADELRRISFNNKIDLDDFNKTFNSLLNPEEEESL